MTNQTNSTLPLAFNIADESRHIIAKRPVFEVPGSKAPTFKGRIIKNLVYHQAHNNRLRALFFTIIDALIRKMLRTKEDIERNKENDKSKHYPKVDSNRTRTPLEKYLFVKSCEAQLQMAALAQDKYGQEAYKTRLAYLNAKVKDSQSPQLEIYKTDLEALKKNPESFKIGAVDKLKKAKEEIISQSQAYAEWNKLDYLLDEVRKIKTNVNTQERNKQLEKLLEDCPLSYLKDKTDAQTAETVETALIELIKQHVDTKKNFYEKKTQFLNATAQERIKFLNEKEAELKKELNNPDKKAGVKDTTIVGFLNIAETFDLLEKDVWLEKITAEINAALKARELSNLVDNGNKNPEPTNQEPQAQEDQDTLQLENPFEETDNSDKKANSEVPLEATVSSKDTAVSVESPSLDPNTPPNEHSDSEKVEKPQANVQSDEPKKEDPKKPEDKKEPEPGFFTKIGQAIGVIPSPKPDPKPEEPNKEQELSKSDVPPKQDSSAQSPAAAQPSGEAKVNKRKSITIEDPQVRQSKKEKKIAQIDAMKLDVKKDYLKTIEAAQKKLVSFRSNLDIEKDENKIVTLSDNVTIYSYYIAKLEVLQKDKEEALKANNPLADNK